MIKLIPYSLLNLCTTISRCNKPKKPHLNPNPNAEEFSGSYEIDESFNFNFAILSFNKLYSELSHWKQTTEYNRFARLNPGNGLSVGELCVSNCISNLRV